MLSATLSHMTRQHEDQQDGARGKHLEAIDEGVQESFRADPAFSGMPPVSRLNSLRTSRAWRGTG